MAIDADAPQQGDRPCREQDPTKTQPPTACRRLPGAGGPFGKAKLLCLYGCDVLVHRKSLGGVPPVLRFRGPPRELVLFNRLSDRFACPREIPEKGRRPAGSATCTFV